MELSNRLKAVAGLVTAGSVVCDAGCDHGYVPIYLVRQGICPRAIAMDINAGPLRRAQENIRACGLDAYITTRLSDGVRALKDNEADCLILAGLGGNLTIRILTQGAEKVAKMRELILQPQSEIAAVRRYLRASGFAVVKEDMVYEGKYYPMMKVTPVSGTGVQDLLRGGDGICADVQTRKELYDRYGGLLLRGRHPVLYRYLLWEREREIQIRKELQRFGAGGTQKNEARRRELERAGRLREYALTYYTDQG